MTNYKQRNPLERFLSEHLLQRALHSLTLRSFASFPYSWTKDEICYLQLHTSPWTFYSTSGVPYYSLFDNLSKPCLAIPFFSYNFSRLPYQLATVPLYLYFYDSFSAFPLKDHSSLDDYDLICYNTCKQFPNKW